LSLSAKNTALLIEWLEYESWIALIRVNSKFEYSSRRFSVRMGCALFLKI
jgi:hypothetical protein